MSCFDKRFPRWRNNALAMSFTRFPRQSNFLAQGLLPPDLMRKAVMEDFVPAQKK